MFTTTGAWGLWGDGAWQSRKDFIKNSCCHNDTTAKEPHRPNTAITIMKLYECCIVEAYYDFKKRPALLVLLQLLTKGITHNQ